MEELFERLMDSFKEYQTIESLYYSIKNPAPKDIESLREHLEKKKYKFQDNLNDYIDKRIELASRK